MKKRDIFYSLILLAGITMLSSACKKDEEKPIELDFNITIPSTWRYFKYDNSTVVYYAYSPLENEDDSISEDVLVHQEPALGGSLSTYFSAAFTILSNDSTFEVVSVNDTTINGEPCRRLDHYTTIYDIKNNDTTILDAQLLRYFFVHNDEAYTVSFSALQQTFPTYKPVFDDIINSFSFKE
jgi:hypothetical protein